MKEALCTPIDLTAFATLSTWLNRTSSSLSFAIISSDLARLTIVLSLPCGAKLWPNVSSPARSLQYQVTFISKTMDVLGTHNMRNFLIALMLLLLPTLSWADEKTLTIFAPFVEPSEGLLAWTDLSLRQQEILLTVEDPNFWSHKGIDTRTPGAGITTITQAVVKRLYFENFTKGPLNKLRQSRIAQNRVHPNVAKETQLNAFLNIAYFGHRQGVEIVGFEAAAQHFFYKPINALEEREYVLLVGLLIGPNRWKPGTEDGEERADRIERLLAGGCEPKKNRDVYFEACSE